VAGCAPSFALIAPTGTLIARIDGRSSVLASISGISVCAVSAADAAITTPDAPAAAALYARRTSVHSAASVPSSSSRVARSFGSASAVALIGLQPELHFAPPHVPLGCTT
jgi:hypothetical protein